MERLKMVLAFCTFLSIYFNGFAQDCIVQADALKGKYEGSCHKGKANGQGKAAGIDTYEGLFKDGLPDGQGTYTWHEGHSFVGNFKKGLKDGKGAIHYKITGGADSIVRGFWKKDKYAGEYEKPFEIQNTSSRITRVNCRLTNQKGKNITVSVSRIGDGVPVLRNVEVLQGTFYNQNSTTMQNTSIARINDVTFPFRAILTFSDGESVQILFNEKADYDVEILLI